MEVYLQRTQECILQVLKQQTNLFLHAIEGLVTTLTAASAGKTLKISSSKETSINSPSKVTQKSKEQKIAISLSLDNTNACHVQEHNQLRVNVFALFQSPVDEPGKKGMAQVYCPFSC